MKRMYGACFVAFGLLVGCAEVGEEREPMDETTLYSDPADTVGDKQGSSACNQRWQAPSGVHAARAVSHQGASRQCSGRAQSGALRFGRFIQEHFGGEIDTAVPGNGIQIYNCRTVRGGRSRSVHGDGRAVDIFIPTLRGGAANNAKGDPIANWLATNAAYIGIQYIIWDRTSFRGNRSTQSKCYTGSHPHNDHIHVELTWDAARERTPFFAEDAASTIPASTPAAAPAAASENSDASATEHDHGSHESHETPRDVAADDPYANTQGTAWLGEPCDRDAHCIQTGDVPASCVVPDGATSGFCTVSCDGFCPDKSGHSETFCATANMMGFGAVGLCMAKSTSRNGYCSAWPAFDSFEVRRFVDQSNASARTAIVCAAAPARDIASEDSVGDAGNQICQDTTLPVSDHGRGCSGVGNNQWRCACSERYQTSVSQVCRDGSWVNYELNPRDCSRCNGEYSSGCEP